MNLGGYQNNLGPWNMQQWRGGGPPSWWQGHDQGSWNREGSNPAGNPIGGEGGAPPAATTTGQSPSGEGQGGFDLSHLMHILTGGQGNLSQMFSGGQMPNAQTLFKGMTDGSLQVPSAQNMFQNLIGGVQNGSITPQNMRPNFGNLAAYVGGQQGNGGQANTGPNLSTSSFGVGGSANPEQTHSNPTAYSVGNEHNG